MIKVSVTKKKYIDHRSSRIDEETFEYYLEDDVKEFAKKVNETVFNFSEDSDKVLIRYRNNVKAEYREITSKALHYMTNRTIIESRIISDLKNMNK